MTTLVPRQKVPPLDVATAGGGRWRLADRRPDHFTMVVFYRGLHCPICGTYLADLEARLGELAQRGVDVVAVSSDTEERALEAQRRWNLAHLTLGYGLDLEAARAWGLFVSSGRGKTSAGVEEPARFSEPGLFLVRRDGTLYFSAVQTMPFTRPGFADILKALDFVLKNDYPARGEVTEPSRPS